MSTWVRLGSSNRRSVLQLQRTSLTQLASARIALSTMDTQCARRLAVLSPPQIARRLDAAHGTNIHIFMATTVHIPTELLARVDRRAKVLGISRNRLIVEALESSLVSRREWPPELVAMLAEPPEPEAVRALAESLAEVSKRRVNRRKSPEFSVRRRSNPRR
jgi:hypothetical protein